METRWIEKNVDLELLSVKIEGFLRERGFETRAGKRDGIEILAVNVDEGAHVRVLVEGDSTDFKVAFDSPADKRPIYVSSLLDTFGFGFLLKKKVKVFDFCQKLEEDFWVFLDRVVEEIAGSALRPATTD